MIRTLMPFTSCKQLFTFLFSLFFSAITFSQTIVSENNLPGTPQSVWDVSGAGDRSIQGFATEISVNKGETVHFKIQTNANNYTIDIYRLGYYQGNGARLQGAANATASLPQIQPPYLYNATTGKTDCSNWSESASWQVPVNAVSGIYIAKLTRTDTHGSSHIVFIVRDDAGTSNLLFKTSDATWQAYNNFGGNSLYVNGSGTSVPGFNHATKVSYNRPFYTRNGGGGGGAAEDWLFNAEYPMVRWLERNGYDVSYTTDVDMDKSPTPITPALHKVLLSVGHDEYWSAAERSKFENARNVGVHLAFFDGNEIYWKTRWEDNNRTLVCYKEGTLGENVCGAKCDPLPNTWTGSWRDGCSSYGSNDGCRPENALSGQISWNGTTSSIQVPDTYKNLRFWRNTSVASLGNGQTATLSSGSLGYEWDWEQYSASLPPGRFTMSSTTVNGHTHKLSLYRHSSGALVFGAGTVQWSWGLDGIHDRGASTEDVRMQQATVNLFADMGAQPATLQPGLFAATASTDNLPPSSAITTPVNGASFSSGSPVTIGGTAADAGGGVVAGVEVSVDGGTTWQAASGRANWTYSWTPGAAGPVTIKTRSVDDIGNLENPGTSPSANAITVSVAGVAPGVCPCTVFQPADAPATPTANDGQSIELGMKFRVTQDGLITGIRYYKGTGTSGTHTGNLWSSTGTLLAQAVFTNESLSGWQQVSFSSPVAVTANTTYIASFFSSSGDYGFTNPFFTQATVNGPVRGLATGEDGPNGVYKYTNASAFPTDNYQSSNYWVDVVFNTNGAPADVTPPTITSVSPYNGASGISTGASVNITFSESIDAATVTNSAFEIRDNANAAISSVVSYNSATHVVTITPSSPLELSKTYTVTVKGGATDPRVKDLAGNALGSNFSISFTTSTIAPPSPADGSGGPILVISSTANPFSRYPVEILRAEGLNEFSALDINQVTPAILNDYDVVLLGEMPMTAANVTMLTNWTTAGGTLVTLKPDAQLSALLGITPVGASLLDKYLLVNTATGPGTGIVNQTIQYHGAADKYTLNGATSLANLYSDASTATVYPAVTTKSVGPNGGVAVAFTYDLAKSVVYTRQGNPDWAGQKRDGQSGPIRSDDQFFPDWIDFNKVAIPQADEQQHLLANIIIKNTLHRKPLPKFWFLPKGLKAAVVMTGDNHGDYGMKPRFDINISESTPGCSVDDWECIRSTGYLYVGSTFTSAQAKQYSDLGFEVALHVNTNCANFTASEFQNFITSQNAVFQGTYPLLPKPTTNRTHCIAWPSFSMVPEVEVANGIRLDANYYYWPASWINNRPGMFTGSGMPMRFAKADGSLIDCYQAVTQMPDESGESFPQFSDALLDKAVGPEGFYGVFTTNIHFDNTNSAEANSIVASAKARGVPVVTAKQMLTWLDGRNSSSFGPMTWNGNTLNFSIVAGAGAKNLKAMLPVASQNGQLISITKNGSSVTFSSQTIKGIQYAFFDAATANYTASYAADNVAPVITQVIATPHADGTATITWTTGEAADSKVDYGSVASALNSSSNNAGLVTSHTITLNNLNQGSTYYFRVTSADASANSSTEPVTANAPLSFTMPSVCVSDLVVSDFSQGTPDAGSTVSSNGDGEVTLKPTLSEDFSGNTIPAGWSEGIFNAGGTTYSNGTVTVNGTHLYSNAAYGVGTTLEFTATFNSGSFQNIGFSNDQSFDTAPWIVIGQGGSPNGNLFARAYDGTLISLGSNLLGTSHQYKIKWNVNNFEFYVDGSTTPSATISLAVNTNMFLQISDVLNNDGSLTADMIKATPYITPGSFTSRIFDAGSIRNWLAAEWSSDVPAGTSLSILIRKGNTPVPDGSWTSYIQIPASGGVVGGSSRYIQYRTDLATSDNNFTPALKGISISCNSGDVVPPVIITRNAVVQADANGAASIQPQDVIVSVTDSSGVDNSSIKVSQTQFSCSDSHQAYVSDINTGNQAWYGTLGLEFRVNNPAGITINQLGAFDHLGDGITGSQNGGVRVNIWDKSSTTIVPGLDAYIVGQADHYSRNYRMKDIAPVTLPPGDYVVVTLGYNDNELIGNSNNTAGWPAGDLGNGAISYIGTSRYEEDNDSLDFDFPNVPDNSPNRYLAGTFSYSTGSMGQGGDNLVTVTAKDVYGNVAQATATVTVICNSSPVITTQPQNKQACEGGVVTFTSAASGTTSPSVRWQVSTNGTTWNDISGANTGILSFTAAFTDNNKQYRAVWTIGQTSVNSDPATLTVYQIPTAGITIATTVLTCTTSTISVTATGGGTYKWEDNSTSATRTLTAAGTYMVTVTGTGGCTASKSITITSNKTAPVITPLTGGTLTCTTTSVSVTASATGQGALSYAWNGGTQGASANIRTFTAAGTYTVTVTDAANGCSSTASVVIGISNAVPAAGITNNSATTVLTCTTPSISVTATGGGTYKWEDNSTSATRTLTASGTYTVTVTGTGGCTASKSITITSNKTAPVITPLTGGTLTCTTTSVSVTASATGQGALSYAWNGGTQGASANIRTFTAAGTYTVTVTDAANGCSSTASVVIGISNAVPAAGITNNSATTVLTCTTPSISVTATGGGTYKWEDNSTSATRTLTAAGTYTVTVTGTGGCTASKSITITSNKTAPVITPLAGGTLTCTTTSVSVTASATGQGALSYAWNGGTQGASANIRTFTAAGTYTVTVTDAANGCSSMASVIIGISNAVPAAGITNNSATTVITCTTSTISVTATGGGTYKWEDNSTSATRTLTAAGTYMVTVTGTGGCTASKSITITSNKTAPVITPLTGGTLTCTTTSVSVTASATGQGALSYAWSGGTQGASSTIRTFTAAGTYTVTVTSAANGCSSTASVNIAGSTQSNVSLINNSGTSVLTCNTPAISLTATGGGTYKWNDFTTSATKIVITPGTYSVTVTQAGGCTATTSISITSNKTAPVINTLTGGTLSCTTPSVSVTATATGQGALSYAWSGGTQGASSNIRTFIAAGTYTVTVTNAANGCSSTASVLISGSGASPALSSSLTPTATSEIPFSYTATSTVSGTTFSWSRAAVTGISNSAATASAAGIGEKLVNTTRSAITVVYTYTLKANGCSNIQNVIVKVNPSTINCLVNSSMVSTFNSYPVPAGKYLWIYSIFDPINVGTTGKVNFYIYNSKVTYNGNNGLVTINLPYSHIVFDQSASAASTNFVNNVWETVVPLAFSREVFMNGIAYPVPSTGINGGMRNTTWTADIAMDKTGVQLDWKTTVTQFSYLPGNSGLAVKPVEGNIQNSYNNYDDVGTIENYKAYYNYNIGYTDPKIVNCTGSFARTAVVDKTKENTANHLTVSVRPNPSTSHFTLTANSDTKAPVLVRVLDVFGRCIYVAEKVSTNNPLRFGQLWAAGMYFAEVTQGKQIVIVKMVKSN